MGFSGRVAVHSDICAFKGSSWNCLDIGNAVGSSHADGDIATRGDRGNRNLHGTRWANKGNTMEHTVLTDGHVGTRNSTYFVCVHSDGENGHVADVIGGRLHTIRHDRAITQHMIGLPIIEGANMKFISKRLGGITSQIANVQNSIDSVVSIVIPNSIIAACSSLLNRRHGAISTAGRTYAKIIVVFPVGRRTRTNICIGTFVLGTHHGFTEGGTTNAPVSGLAAVAHGKEILVRIGQVVDIADGEARTSPAGVAAMGGIVSKTNTTAQIAIAIGVGAMAELIDVLEAMFGIIIIVGGVPNGRTSHSFAPTATVFTSNEKHIVQIARVGHGVLFVLQGLVEHGRHLCDGLSGETAVEHVHELVTVNAGI